MRRVAIMQARSGSTRLPRKVLLDIAGRPMLSQVLRRVKEIELCDDIVVATTQSAEDNEVVALADLEGVRWYRGSDQDVLDRYVEAARESRADVVVRITADCPLLDPDESNRVIAALSHPSASVDYASNVLRRTLPRGLDTEAFTMDALLRVAAFATSRPAREHVTWLIHTERPDLFTVRSVTAASDDSDLRWTVDTAEDLDVVRRGYSALGLDRRIAPWTEVRDHFRSHPELIAINASVHQKTS